MSHYLPQRFLNFFLMKLSWRGMASEENFSKTLILTFEVIVQELALVHICFWWAHLYWSETGLKKKMAQVV